MPLFYVNKTCVLSAHQDMELETGAEMQHITALVILPPLSFPDFISVDLTSQASGVFYCCTWSNVKEGDCR